MIRGCPGCGHCRNKIWKLKWWENMKMTGCGLNAFALSIWIQTIIFNVQPNIPTSIFVILLYRKLNSWWGIFTGLAEGVPFVGGDLLGHHAHERWVSAELSRGVVWYAWNCEFRICSSFRSPQYRKSRDWLLPYRKSSQLSARNETKFPTGR